MRAYEEVVVQVRDIPMVRGESLWGQGGGEGLARSRCGAVHLDPVCSARGLCMETDSGPVRDLMTSQ